MKKIGVFCGFCINQSCASGRIQQEIMRKQKVALGANIVSRLQAKRCTATLTLLVLLIPPLVHSPVLVLPLRLLVTTSPMQTSKK